MLSCLIIDSCKESARILIDKLNKNNSEISVIGIGYSFDEGYDLIITHDPDLVFIDIDFKQRFIFDYFNYFKKITFTVVFTINKTRFSNNSTLNNKIHYLRKPIVNKKLTRIIKKIKKTHNLNNYQKSKVDTNTKNSDISTNQDIKYLNKDEIIYFKKGNIYTNIIFLNNERIYISQSIRIYEYKTSRWFLRTGKSYIININNIKNIKEENDFSVMITNGTLITNPKSKKDLISLNVQCKECISLN